MKTSAALSVAVWKSLLCPEAMAQYVLTAYNGKLSWSALEHLVDADFVVGANSSYPGLLAGPMTENVENLQAALGELYPGFQLNIWRTQDNKLHCRITVPGGEAEELPQTPAPLQLFDVYVFNKLTNTWPLFGGNPFDQITNDGGLTLLARGISREEVSYLCHGFKRHEGDVVTRTGSQELVEDFWQVS